MSSFHYPFSAGDRAYAADVSLMMEAGCILLTAGEALIKGEPVYFKAADGFAWRTSAASSATTNGFLGMAAETVAAGATVLIQTRGVIDMSTFVAARTIVNDDFARADSNTIGGVWTENLNGSAAGDVKIASNKVQYGAVGVNSGETLTVTHPIFDNASDTISMSFKFQVNSNPNSRNAYVGLFGTTSVAALTGIKFINGTTNNVSIYTNAGAAATGSFTINTGTDYYCWIDIVPNGSNCNISLYLNTTNSKPAATLTASNQIYGSTNTNVNIGVDSSNDGIWYFDDVVVTFTPAALTADTLYYLSNTTGRIKTSAGSTSKKIGRTLTATKLHIKNENE